MLYLFKDSCPQSSSSSPTLCNAHMRTIGRLASELDNNATILNSDIHNIRPDSSGTCRPPRAVYTSGTLTTESILEAELNIYMSSLYSIEATLEATEADLSMNKRGQRRPRRFKSHKKRVHPEPQLMPNMKSALGKCLTPASAALKTYSGPKGLEHIERVESSTSINSAVPGESLDQNLGDVALRGNNRTSISSMTKPSLIVKIQSPQFPEAPESHFEDSKQILLRPCNPDSTRTKHRRNKSTPKFTSREDLKKIKEAHAALEASARAKVAVLRAEQRRVEKMRKEKRADKELERKAQENRRFKATMYNDMAERSPNVHGDEGTQSKPPSTSAHKKRSVKPLIHQQMDREWCKVQQPGWRRTWEILEQGSLISAEIRQSPRSASSFYAQEATYSKQLNFEQLSSTSSDEHSLLPDSKIQPVSADLHSSSPTNRSKPHCSHSHGLGPEHTLITTSNRLTNSKSLTIPENKCNSLPATDRMVYYPNRHERASSLEGNIAYEEPSFNMHDVSLRSKLHHHAHCMPQTSCTSEKTPVRAPNNPGEEQPVFIAESFAPKRGDINAAQFDIPHPGQRGTDTQTNVEAGLHVSLDHSIQRVKSANVINTNLEVENNFANHVQTSSAEKLDDRDGINSAFHRADQNDINSGCSQVFVKDLNICVGIATYKQNTADLISKSHDTRGNDAISSFDTNKVGDDNCIDIGDTEPFENLRNIADVQVAENSESYEDCNYCSKHRGNCKVIEDSDNSEDVENSKGTMEVEKGEHGKGGNNDNRTNAGINDDNGDAGSNDKNGDAGSNDNNGDAGSNDKNGDAGSNDNNGDAGSNDNDGDAGSNDNNSDAGSNDNNGDAGSNDNNGDAGSNDNNGNDDNTGNDDNDGNDGNDGDDGNDDYDHDGDDDQDSEDGEDDKDGEKIVQDIKDRKSEAQENYKRDQNFQVGECGPSGENDQASQSQDGFDKIEPGPSVNKSLKAMESPDSRELPPEALGCKSLTLSTTPQEDIEAAESSRNTTRGSEFNDKASLIGELQYAKECQLQAEISTTLEKHGPTHAENIQVDSALIAPFVANASTCKISGANKRLVEVHTDISIGASSAKTSARSENKQNAERAVINSEGTEFSELQSNFTQTVEVSQSQGLAQSRYGVPNQSRNNDHDHDPDLLNAMKTLLHKEETTKMPPPPSNHEIDDDETQEFSNQISTDQEKEAVKSQSLGAIQSHETTNETTNETTSIETSLEMVLKTMDDLENDLVSESTNVQTSLDETSLKCQGLKEVQQDDNHDSSTRSSHSVNRNSEGAAFQRRTLEICNVLDELTIQMKRKAKFLPWNDTLEAEYQALCLGKLVETPLYNNDSIIKREPGLNDSLYTAASLAAEGALAAAEAARGAATAAQGAANAAEGVVAAVDMVLSFSDRHSKQHQGKKESKEGDPRCTTARAGSDDMLEGDSCVPVFETSQDNHSPSFRDTKAELESSDISCTNQSITQICFPVDNVGNGNKIPKDVEIHTPLKEHRQQCHDQNYSETCVNTTLEPHDMIVASVNESLASKKNVQLRSSEAFPFDKNIIIGMGKRENKNESSDLENAILAEDGLGMQLCSCENGNVPCHQSKASIKCQQLEICSVKALPMSSHQNSLEPQVRELISNESKAEDIAKTDKVWLKSAVSNRRKTLW